MDIEGAEWEILRDSATLRILKTTQSTLILALHPGLQRPPKSISSTIGRLRFYWWNIRNILDSWFLFKRVSPYCLIYRTNLNQVRRPSMFCLLVLAGNHEFVFSFGEKNWALSSLGWFFSYCLTQFVEFFGLPKNQKIAIVLTLTCIYLWWAILSTQDWREYVWKVSCTYIQILK